jgi:DNA-binding winged helix-turn-helix (wHTH) protein
VRIRFDRFIADSDTRQLTDGSREIRVSPKALDLLLGLLAERPRVLSKGELQEHLWPDTFVAEANLSNLVAELRAALGDHARTPRFIRTVHGFGYAFCGEAAAMFRQDRETRSPACWLEWGTRRLPLVTGENVVGRDPDVQVRLDATTVSRRHARVLVTDGETMLEDFGSKNGTYRGDDRVTSPVTLVDGDVVRIGSVTLTYHARAAQGSTETQRSAS